jgi:hypothetical protein
MIFKQSRQNKFFYNEMTNNKGVEETDPEIGALSTLLTYLGFFLLVTVRFFLKK